MLQFVKTFVVFGIFIIFLSKFVVSSFAFEPYYIDFSKPEWVSYENGGSVSREKEYSVTLISAKSSNKSPYVKSNIYTFPGQDLIIEVSLNFLSSGSFGNGFTLYSDLPTDNGVNNSTNEKFLVWMDNANGFGIYSWLCPIGQPDCTLPYKINLYDNITFFDFNLHKVFIVYESGSYSIFFENFRNNVFTSVHTPDKPKSISLGNSIFLNGFGSWSSFRINYVFVSDLSRKNSPINIILPGLGASWDFAAMLNGTSGTNWKIPAFINNYDSLIKSFENAGYVKNENLFIFAYDWRKPLDSLADQLNTYITNNTGNGQKVNLIGHSMGGLIARNYLQKYGQDKINKLITLGSPHEGSVDSYSIWEGATLWDDIWWGKLAIESTAQLNKKAGETKLQTLRKQIPSVKDLLPTFDFLEKNNKLIALKEMNQINGNLSKLNAEFDFNNSSIFALTGSSGNTKKTIRIKDRDDIDKKEGLWEDGKPINSNAFYCEGGDGTVLTSSARMNIKNYSEVSSNHFGLPSNRQAIEKVFEILGLDKVKIEIRDEDTRKNVLAIFLRSPGILSVCNLKNVCNESLGNYLPDEKAFFLPNYNNETLNIAIKEAGLGKYKLHFGKLNNESVWKSTDGKLKESGQTDLYQLMGLDGDLFIETDTKTDLSLLKACKENLNDTKQNWDKNGNIEFLTNENLSKSSRLRSFRLLLSTLSDILIFSANNNDQESVSKILGCWQTINDQISHIYASDKDSVKNKHLDLTTDLLGKVDKQIISSSNKFTNDLKAKILELLTSSNHVGAENSAISTHLAFSLDKLILTNYQIK